MGQDRKSASSQGSRTSSKNIENLSKADLKKLEKEQKKEDAKAMKEYKRKEKERKKLEAKGENLTKAERLRRHMQRMEILARPTSRHLRVLWDEKCDVLPRDRRDKIKSALEEDYFLSPEQTEQYFQMVNASSKRWTGGGPNSMVNRKEADKSKELRQRQKWLVNFSAQVAYRLCDYIAKGQKEMLVSNRLRSIADVVLERVAEILGEPKPTRSNPSRLARFMVAISDRIAVWIENAVYRADAVEDTLDGQQSDTHIRLDNERIYA